MKIVTNKKDVSISIKGKIKKYSPFIVIQDEDLEYFINAGYTEVSELMNLTEIKELSENINNKVNYFNESITSMESQQKDIQDNIEELQQAVKYINETTLLLDEIKEDITSKYNEIKSIYNKFSKLNLNYIEKINLFNNIIDKATNEQTGKINNMLNDLLTNVNNNIDNYKDININIETIINNAKIDLNNIILQAQKEINMYVDKCKAWANNPVNIPVEDGLYSAKHYSMKTRGNK